MSDKSRIRWLCRRGMKELDVLLERFVDQHYDTLDEHERAQLFALLEREDPDLYALIVAHAEPANPVQSNLLARMRRFTRA